MQRAWAAVIVAVSMIGAVLPAQAQTSPGTDFPTKRITLIVPFPPGGSTDVAGRILAQHLSTTLKQAIVVENRAGAAGALGIRAVAVAPPDGYTLGVSGVGTSAILEAFGRDAGFSPSRDLTYVGHMGSSALLVAARTDLGVKALPDLIALAKTRPDALNYGTSGAGSPGHLAMEWLLLSAGIKIRHVPYKGNAPLLGDLLGKQIDIGILTIPGTPDQIKSNGIVGLAVTGATRSSELPSVQTVQESGFKDFAAELWNMLVAPKDTPAPIVAALNAALADAMKDPAVQARFQSNGLVPVTLTAAQSRSFVDAERLKWTDIVKKSGATME